MADRYTIERMLSEEPLPLDGFLSNTHVNDMDSFYKWLLMRYKELLTIQNHLEEHDRMDDELYEYSVSGAGVLREVIVNYRKTRDNEQSH